MKNQPIKDSEGRSDSIIRGGHFFNFVVSTSVLDRKNPKSSRRANRWGFRIVRNKPSEKQ